MSSDQNGDGGPGSTPEWCLPTFDTVEEERQHRKQRLAATYRIFAKLGFKDGAVGAAGHFRHAVSGLQADLAGAFAYVADDGGLMAGGPQLGHRGQACVMADHAEQQSS